MKYLHRFRLICMAVLTASVVGIYFEIYVRDIHSMGALYGWAAAAIAALVGNAAAALWEWGQNRDKP